MRKEPANSDIILSLAMQFPIQYNKIQKNVSRLFLFIWYLVVEDFEEKN